MIEFNENEEHLLTIRKHWFVLLNELIPLMFLALLPAVLVLFYAYTPAVYQQIIDRVLEDAYALVVSGYALWLLLLWTTAFARLTDYYLDAWYITDKRIIDVEQRGFFAREIAVLVLDRIQDIKISISGLVQTFFEFGDLHAQTAGEQREFIIRGVYSPYDCKEKIMQVIRQYRNQGNSIADTAKEDDEA